MNSPSWEEQSFIKVPAVEDVLTLLRGETAELQLEADIQLDVALQALRDGLSLTEIIQATVQQLEKYVIAQILRVTDGNKAETARILKVDYKTLYRKMYRYFGTLLDFFPDAEPDSQPICLNGDAMPESSESP